MLPSFKVKIYGKVVLDSFLWFRVLMKSFCLFHPRSALQYFPDVATASATQLPFMKRKQLVSLLDVFKLTAEHFPSWPLPTVALLQVTPWHWEAEETLRSKPLIPAPEAFALYQQSLADYSHDHQTVKIGDLRHLLQLSPQTIYDILPQLEPIPGSPTRIHFSTLLRLAKADKCLISCIRP